MAVLGMGAPASRVSFDPEVMREIQVYGQREDDVAGHNVVAPEFPLDGIIGIAQPVQPHERGQGADDIAQHITDYLQNHHDPLNPEHDMHDAFVSANKHAVSAYRAGVMATFVRFFPKKEGSRRLAGVYGSVGDVPLYALVERGIFKKRLNVDRVYPTPKEAGHALTGEEVDEEHIVTGAIKLRRNTRYLITSTGAARHNNMDLYGPDSLTSGMDSQAIADKLAQEGSIRNGDRVTKVIEINRKRRKAAAPAGAAAVGAAGVAAPAAAAKTRSPEQKAKRRRNLGIAAGVLVLGGILAGVMTIGLTSGNAHRGSHSATSSSHPTSASQSHSPSSGPSRSPSSGPSTGSAGGSAGGTTGNGNSSGAGGSGSGSGGAESAPVGEPAGAPFAVEPGRGFTDEIVQYAATQGKTITIDRGFTIYLDGESHLQPNNMIVSPNGQSGIYKMWDGHYGISKAASGYHWTLAMKQIIDADLAAG